MIQRTFLRQFRVAGTAVRLLPRTSLLRPQSQSSSISTIQTLRHGRRWYSSEPEVKKNGNEESEAASEAQSKSAEVKDPVKEGLEAKSREVADLKDKYLRSVADFRNLQDRTKREVQSAKDFAIQKFAKDLMESVDNLDRALAMVPEEKLSVKDKSEEAQDLFNLYDGLRMTERILMQTLKKHGLERFDPSVEGEKFNPNEHEATFMTPMQGKEDGTVINTQVKGFRLNNRIVRAAKVGVVKN